MWLNVCLVCIMCGVCVCVYAHGRQQEFPGPEHTHTRDQHKQQGLGQSQPCKEPCSGQGEGAIRSLTGGCHMRGQLPRALPGDRMPWDLPTWEASSLPGRTHVCTHIHVSLPPTNVALTLAATGCKGGCVKIQETRQLTQPWASAPGRELGWKHVLRPVQPRRTRSRPPGACPHLQQRLVGKGHDSLEDDDICTIQSFLQRRPCQNKAAWGPTGQPSAASLRPTQSFFPAVGGEVMNGAPWRSCLLELLGSGDDEVEVKGIWVVKVGCCGQPAPAAAW